MFPTSKSTPTTSSIWLRCCTKPTAADPELLEAKPRIKTDTEKKPGGWKAMPFILGNETFERLASVGLIANFMVYLTRELHMSLVSASNFLNIWSGIANFAPLIGAFISDAYVGRFKTIAFASFASFLGMLTLTLTAWIPQLHPPKCDPTTSHCQGPNKAQLGVLATSLALLSIGSGGIRPCSIPFGVDQFDPSTEDGVKGINSFFNWYYATFTVVILICLTLVVYIQDSVSWVWGFGIPTALMACSIVMFFVGTRIYVHMKPEGSIFSGIVQVLVAAFKKRKLQLPLGEEEKGALYDPPFKRSVYSKLKLTDQFRFLSKAAIITEDDIKPDGSHDKWRLSSIQEVEEVKCIIKVFPIWASGIVSFTSLVQQGTFTGMQALMMDRHLGPNFQVPAGSISVISMLTIGLWIPIYDRILVPYLRSVTKKEGGITLLQRIGFGIFLSILAMIVAGLVEHKRRVTTVSLHVVWLAPQLVLMGFSEAFNMIGQLELFNKEFPEHMRSISNALLFCSIASSSYLSTLLVNIVHGVTGGHGHPDWLTSDINAGNLDYFYYLLAVMGAVNLVYFVYFARRYKYKESVKPNEEEYGLDVEMSPIKS